MEIKNIGVHHFAGNLTLPQLNNLHRSEWPELPSKLRPDLWVGYNFVIWKDGTYLQCRYIGEETAAQRGHNLDTVSICLAGDFTVGKDSPTFEQKKTLVWLIQNLVGASPQDMGSMSTLKCLPSTLMYISKDNIFPHRVLQPNHTECYGSSLDDNWAKNLAFPKTVPIVVPTVVPIVTQGPEWTRLMQSWAKLLELWNKIIGNRPLGGAGHCWSDVRN